MAGGGWRVKRGRKALAAVVLAVLGRGLVAAVRLDRRVRKEVGSWPDPCVVTLGIAPWGPRVSWRRRGRLLTCLGARDVDADLLVTFKSVDVALPALLGMKAILTAFAEHRATLRGDIGHALSLVRCLHAVEEYLFPDIINRKILPHPPRRSTPHLVAYALLVQSSARVTEGGGS